MASRDGARYRAVFLGGVVAALLIAAVFAALQSTLLHLRVVGVPIGARLTANLVGAVAGVIVCWFVPFRRLRWPAKLLGVGLVSLLCSLVRIVLQVVLGIHALGDGVGLLLDFCAAMATTVYSVGMGLLLAEYQSALTRRTHAARRQAVVAAQALEALRAEELRVRREVAQGLHGTVQQQLVLIDAELRAITVELTAAHPAADGPVTGRTAVFADRLDKVRDTLDRLRSEDIRDMSRMLYPSGANLGLAQAARVLIRQIPSGIQVAARIDGTVVQADDPETGGLPLETRMLALRVLEEAVGNALRHGGAGRLDVAMSVDGGGVLRIQVDDDGTGLGADPAPERSGLRLLEERLRALGGSLDLSGSRSVGGACLSAALPLGAST